ncbi:hypothetical protein VTN96DRAFT_7237 [Rasamsonia emersonii]
MSSLRSPTLHSLLRCPGSSRVLRVQQQRRWAQVHDVRFLATHRDPAHILEKYKDKLRKKAEAEGHDSIESLKEAYKDKIEEYRRKASAVAPDELKSSASNNTNAESKTPFSPPPPPSPSSTSTSASSSSSSASSPSVAAAAKAVSGQTPGIKPLSSFLDIEKILTLPPKEIEALWRLRHAGNPLSICATIPLDTYQRMAEAARANPQFILPLPRQAKTPAAEDGNKEGKEQQAATPEGGADIHFLQWSFHPPASPLPTTTPGTQTANTHTSTILFTHLASYKLHGSYAQPHTTVTHYLDLADEKGLVLMHGQVMPDRGVSVTEASWLVSCVQRFYDFGGQGSGRKGELLRMFTRGDVEGFRVEELMEETEKI